MRAPRLCWTGIATALLLGAGVISPAIAEGWPRSVARQHLEVTVQFDKDEFLLGEPVVAYVTVRNRDTVPHAVFDKFDPEFFIFRYYIRKDDGDEKAFRAWALAEGNFPPRTLQPGESITGIAKIFFGADGWSFVSPGQYTVRVTYQPDITSEPASFAVRAPTTNRESEQARLILGDNEVGYFLLFESGDHLKQGIDRLEELVTDHPDSPLGAYADYALGMNWSSDFPNFIENRLRKAEFDRAIQHLNRSKDRLERLSALYFTASAHDRLSKTYENIGRTDQATRTRQQMERLPEKFPRLQPIIPRVFERLRTAPR
jgi:hypothetical protein